ncbi:uncharacterized protein RHOBADRAFT_51330 [Rhodotorula graminis WP1]|uniref:Ubiquitin-like domain-containing protein n=1 Tax=Rhodotorula graminis (strain WP1) TaxID=578459 RepID=A0A194S9T6_RHOGW|nr:uncharacterized protein RHOBADRAFT_51330 [Rhodotorula graminis WP1]KPV77483.1 hypothetical protein RHOBADRAFT_51330 [Rhodotorula graminis WP1]
MSVLFVELANPDAVDGTASAHLARNGVMIRADQSYEAALAEVRAHWRLKDDLYTCSFSQRRPGRPRPIFIAPSAWSLVDPTIDLELVVIPLNVKAEGDRKQSPAERIGSEPAEGNLVPPTASQATSNGVAPATPSNTDDSDSEVSDSDAEVAPAPAQALDASARTPTTSIVEAVSPAPGPVAGPSGLVHSTPGTAHGSDRDRSPTPSPSNRSAKAKLRHLIEQAECAETRSSSPIPSARPRSRSSTPPSQPLSRSSLEHSIESHASFRIGLDDGGNVAFVPPSPLPRGEPGPSSRSKGKQRARSPSPREEAVSSPVEALKTLKRSPSSLEGTPRKRLHRAPSQARTATLPRIRSPYVAAAAAAAMQAPSPGLSITDSSSGRNSGPSGRAAPRKSHADKRREALARPRVAVPDTRRSSRFHYYLRLPNWPGARGDVTLGLTLQFVFEAAARATGWDVEDLRLTFYSRYACDELELRDDDDGRAAGTAAAAPPRTIVWGFDGLLTGFRDLEEIGLSNGDVVDIDHVPYDPRRAYWDES